MALLNWINGLVGGLLISSCCIVQLFLNLFGIGCAGLNTILLPYRPLFISLTVISLTYAYYRSRPSKWHFTAVLTLTLFLSFSPELLRVYNNYRSSDAQIEGSLPVTTRWQINGMHCEACRSAVIRALKKVDGVQTVDVDLQTGRATLQSSQKIDKEDIVRIVQAAGFEAQSMD